MTKRSKCIELLIAWNAENSSDDRLIHMSDYRQGKNTPLHWAVYHADAYMAHLVFKDNPMQVFSVNRNGCLPFDLIWKMDDRILREYAEIVIEFLHYLLGHCPYSYRTARNA